MATARLPIRSIARATYQTPTQCLYKTSRERLEAYRAARLFSTSTAASNYHGSSFQVPNKRQMKGTNAPKTQQQQALAKGQQIPTDLGLVPQTFITPTGANRPSWVRDLRDRMSMEYYRWRAKLYNLYLSFHYKWWIRTREQKKANGKLILNYPFRTGKLSAVAEELHRNMYTAAAAGDLQTLRQICADGTFAQLRANISRRGRAAQVEWSCERVATPKLVSHRATVLPFKAPDGSTSAIRQAVVRLVTRQRLRHTTVTQNKANAGKTPWQRSIEGQLRGRGDAASAATADAAEQEKEEEVRVSEGEPKEMVEYFVIQRRLWKGAEEPWMVWGVTEETTMQRLAEMKEEMSMMAGARQNQTIGRLQDMVAGSGSRS